MSGKGNNNLVARLDGLLARIAQGQIMEAMREYYDDDVVMEEPHSGQTKGLVANLEREQRFLDSVKQFTRFDVRHRVAGDGVTFYEAEMGWESTDGTHVLLQQVAVATWRDGRIIHERYYYDPRA